MGRSTCSRYSRQEIHLRHRSPPQRKWGRNTVQSMAELGVTVRIIRSIPRIWLFLPLIKRFAPPSWALRALRSLKRRFLEECRRRLRYVRPLRKQHLYSCPKRRCRRGHAASRALACYRFATSSTLAQIITAPTMLSASGTVNGRRIYQKFPANGPNCTAPNN